MSDIQFTEEQLEALLEKKRAENERKRAQEKKQYENRRDLAVENLIIKAKKIAEELKQFKEDCEKTMETQAVELSNYGKMRSNSKGGFTLTHGNGMARVKRRRDTEPVWDERSTKAIELIHAFLYDTVKKRDQDLFEILIGFIQRNKNGDLEYARVMELIQHEHKFKDERWITGLRLIKESYSNVLRGFGYELNVKNEGTGKWEFLNLNFSSI